MSNILYTKFSLLRNGLMVLLATTLTYALHAEGSKDLTPSNTGTPNGVNQFIGYLQHDDGDNSDLFMKPGASPDYRLYVRMLPGETVYYGVRRIPTDVNINQNDLIITIRDAAGNVVATNTLTRNTASPRQSTLNPQPGVIGSHAQAAAGPSSQVGAAGYSALNYTNTTGLAQDFYVEFTQVNEAAMPNGGRGPRKSWYDLWDFSVYDQSGNYRTGRLHARAWSFTAAGGSNLLSTDFVLYGLSPAPTGFSGFYVKRVRLSGMRPFGFFTYFNQFGTTSGTTIEQRRRSQNAKIAYPEYNIFVNDPDSTQYPTATLPTVSVRSLTYYCNQSTQVGNVLIQFESNQPGRGIVIIDLDGTPGYQQNTRDVFIEQDLPTPGQNFIVWNGLDGLGNPVPSGSTIEFNYRFVNSPLNVPLWDVERNNAGLSIEDERPVVTNSLIYWDDRNLTHPDFTPKLMLHGTDPSGPTLHDWGFSADVGDRRLVNTWVYGFSENVVEIISFNYSCDSDFDNVDNGIDIDDDNDGITDLAESYIGDHDNDGVLDYEDPDFCTATFQGINGYDCAINGLPDPSGDIDGDGVPNFTDTDFPTCGGLNAQAICSNFDQDNDGIPNHRDLDSDNDGIPDIVEAGGVDTNGDGVADNITDSDGDGLADVHDNDDTDGPTGSAPCAPFSVCVDTGSTSNILDANNDGLTDQIVDLDGDGTPNYLDLDADNDGIPDVVEVGGTDVNGDGRADGFADSDLDGFNDLVDPIACTSNGGAGLFVPANSTGIVNGGNASGTPDAAFAEAETGDVLFLDLGQELAAGTNYTIIWRRKGTYTNTATATINVEELTGASVSNGINPATPSTTSRTAFVQTTLTTQGPTRFLSITPVAGTTNDFDFDAVAYSIVTCNPLGTALLPTGPDANTDGRSDNYPIGDFDQDGQLNFLDLDADNDGLLDITEAGGTDANGDGQEDNFADVDNDGFNDTVDGDPTNSLAFGNDSAGANTNNATTTTGADTNNDGRPDSKPNDNNDGDPHYNFLDIDADNDGIVDNTEGQATASYIPPAGTDADNDGIDDAYDNDDTVFGGAGSGIVPVNTQGFDEPDYLDLDTDNDGTPDAVEGHDTDGDNIADGGSPANTGLPGGTTDVDGDGLLDGYDNNTASADATNGGLNPNSHPNIDNTIIPERDWRERILNIDTDGDGIVDAVDIDDDNDGILDVNENPCQTRFTFDLGPENWFTLNDNTTVASNPASHSLNGTTNNIGCTINITGPSNQNIAGASPTGTNYLVDADPTGGITYVRSPNLGGVDYSSIIGGTLSYDLYNYRVGFTGNPGWLFNNPTYGSARMELYIENTTGTSIRFVRDLTPAELSNWENGIWNTFTAPVTDAAWSGSQADLVAVMNDVQHISIRVENITGGNTGNCPDVEYYAMDNVVFESSNNITCADSDGDGIPNSLDLDSDNDGIPDLVEAGGVDTNGDGIVDNLTDTDGDGLADIYDSNCSDTACSAATTGNDIANLDSDGDGILDVIDLDADNDGIPDVVEAGGTDTNGDGRIDHYTDSDNDGFADVVDGDVGNDGIADNTANALLVTGPDTTNNGRPNSYVGDDTDGDGLLDHLDLDADNDGIPDVVEAGGTDVNGDGRADNYVDADRDGFNDVVDGDPTNILPVASDVAGTNTANATLVTGPDANNDGAPDNYPAGDLDGDGILNYLDLDADNDGILDIEEAGGTDNDRDGIEDNFVDADNDGFNDNVDGDPTNALAAGADTAGANTANATILTGPDANNDGAADNYPNDNLDGDGNPNFLDIDADNDGIVDNTEGQPTASYIAPTGNDTDGDGIDNAYDNDDTAFGGAGSGIVPNNQDGADNPDYLDLDTDNDRIQDRIEGHDTNGDGVADGGSPAGTGLPGGTADVDGDGLLDGYDNDTTSTDATNTTLNPNSHPNIDKALTAERDWRELKDNDGDGIADIVDIDDDNDGIPDLVEQNGNDPLADTDGDGIPDYLDPDFVGFVDRNGDGVNDNFDSDLDGIIDSYDLDADNDGIPDLVEAGGEDTNGDGRVDDLADADGDGLVDDLDNRDTDGPTGTTPCSPQPNCVLANSTSLLFDTNGDGTNNRQADNDGDGVPNYRDLDADNDGIPDVVEAGGTDANGDGRADNYVDTDGDGFGDFVDGDVGNDGVADNSANALILTGPDTNNNGLADNYPNKNADGDALPNYLDLDADNDGISDVVENSGTDTNGDGRADNYVDTDGDGFNDVVDGDPTNALLVGSDAAGTNTSNALLLTGFDTDNNGTPNTYPNHEQDGDGVLDYLDLDADNDGIPDIVEANGTDENGDGRIDNYVDADGDGFNDVVDGDPTNALTAGNDATGTNTVHVLITTGFDANRDGAPDDYPIGDLDGDGILNHLDLDADGDGILDIEESAGTDANRDGIEDNYVDADGDGFNDNVDGDPTNALAVGDDNPGSNTANATLLTGPDVNGNGDPGSYPNDNQDGDIKPNFLDIDADNDGIVDNTEGQPTGAYIAPTGNDADGDGIDDAYDNNTGVFGGAGSGIIPNNQEGLDEPDYLDLDTDNDGIQDRIEGHDTNGDGVVNGLDASLANSGIGGTVDSDRDGLLDGYDNNTSSTNATNNNLQPTSHPNQYNPSTLERDWRETNSTYATNDVNTTIVGVPVSGQVLTNDEDVEGDEQTLNRIRVDLDGDGIPETIVPLGTSTVTGGVNENQSANPNAGTIVVNSNGTYTYTPAAGFEGEVIVEYEVCDNATPQACASAVLVIDVEPTPTTVNGNVAPAPDVNTTYDGIAVSGQVLANDNDAEGDNFTVTGNIRVDTDGDGILDANIPVGSTTSIGGVSADGGGAVANAGTLVQNANGTYTFTPTPGFTGTVEYSYTVCDDGTPISCKSTFVTIQVLSRRANSTGANDDEEFVDKGTTLRDNVLTNDSDVEGNNQVGGVSLVSGSTNGLLTLNPDGSYEYTPNSSFVGNDEFVYSVCDNGTPQACDTATVYLTILNANRDYSDGPSSYGVAFHRATQDANLDNVPDGTADIWLGRNTDYEEAPAATGADNFDDAMELGTATPGAFPRTVTPNTSYNVELDVSSMSNTTVFYGMWIDWDADGVYDDFYDGTVVSSGGLNTTTVPVTSPAAVGTNLVNIRLRVDDAPFGSGDFAGGRTNGEVEDYQFLMNDPLPIELLYFSARLQGENTAKLDWSTATELNNAGFDVEHALPSTGTPNFQQIGYVQGSGTTLEQQDYQYMVPNLVPGIHYFRIKQVDTDGSYSYTPVRAVEVKSTGAGRIFPTLLREGEETIYLQVQEEGEYEVEILTILGERVDAYRAEMTPLSYHKINLSASRYSSAIYLIRVSRNGVGFTEQVRVE